MIDSRDLIAIQEEDSNQTISIGKNTTLNWMSSREEKGGAVVRLVYKSDAKISASGLGISEVITKINSIVEFSTPRMIVYVSPFPLYLRSTGADTVVIPDPLNQTASFPVVNMMYASYSTPEEIKEFIQANFAHEYTHTLQRIYMKTHLWGGYVACFDEGSAQGLAVYSGFMGEGQLGYYNMEGSKCSALEIDGGYPRGYCIFSQLKQAGLFSDDFFKGLFRSKTQIPNDCEITTADTQKLWIDLISEAAGKDVSGLFKERIWN